MPTFKKKKGFRFFVYSNEHLPKHIHIEKGESIAKFKLNPVELLKSNGFKATELNEIRKLVEENKSLFIRKWNEYFSNQ